MSATDITYSDVKPVEQPNDLIGVGCRKSQLGPTKVTWLTTQQRWIGC